MLEGTPYLIECSASRKYITAMGVISSSVFRRSEKPGSAYLRQAGNIFFCVELWALPHLEPPNSTPSALILGFSFIIYISTLCEPLYQV